MKEKLIIWEESGRIGSKVFSFASDWPADEVGDSSRSNRVVVAIPIWLKGTNVFERCEINIEGIIARGSQTQLLLSVTTSYLVG